MPTQEPRGPHAAPGLPGNGRLAGLRLSRCRRRPAPKRRPEHAPANAPAGHSPALKSRAPVTVNFVNADVEAVTRAMATMIERQIALDPRVKGTMTLYSDQPLTVREAYLNYLSALRGLGFTMVENGGLLKVVPEAEAKLQTRHACRSVNVGVRGDQIITQIFQLNHESPNNLVAVLRPLISANNTINASLGNNSLVITDYADNLQRIAKIIAALDQPAGSDTDVVTLKHAVASDLAPMVQRLADGGGASPGQPGLPAAGGALTVLVDARSNSLILRAANPARLAIARSIIAKLDQPTQGGNAAGNIWVVYLKNADAVKLAAVLRAAFASGAASGGAGRRGTPRHRRSRCAWPTRPAAATPATTPVVGIGQPVDRRLHPGRPGHQLAHHHRARAAVPATAQRHRPARFAPGTDLHRDADRQGRCRQGGRHRHPVAGHLGRPEQFHQLCRRHQLHRRRQHRQPHRRHQPGPHRTGRRWRFRPA